MDTITNLKITVKVDGKEGFTERYIFPNYRNEYNRIDALIQEDDEEPYVIVGSDDNLWWNDDIYFLLDRMQGCEVMSRTIWPDGLERFSEDITNNPFKVGEMRNYKNGRLEVIAIADTTPMTDGRMVKIG